KALAVEGSAVVANYASSKTGADKVVSEITSAGGKAVAVQGDVARKADIERLFAETKKAFGRLDILVNNAGIYEFSPLESITEEQFHKQLDGALSGDDGGDERDGFLLSVPRCHAGHCGRGHFFGRAGSGSVCPLRAQSRWRVAQDLRGHRAVCALRKRVRV